MAGVRAFMAAYPYNCIEQLLSRAIVLGDQGAWQSLAGELPTYQAPDGLLRYFPSDSLQGSEALTAYVLRSEEHTSELQSLMRISYDVFCLKKKNNTKKTIHNNNKRIKNM